MSETKHTPGPWLARHQTGKKDGFIQKTGWIHIEVVNEEVDHRFNRGIAQLHNISEPNLKRIIDCVNACEGINPEAVPDMLEALEHIDGIINNSNGIEGWHLNGDIATWEEFREELDLIKSAIAKATGQEAEE